MLLLISLAWRIRCSFLSIISLIWQFWCSMLSLNSLTWRIRCYRFSTDSICYWRRLLSAACSDLSLISMSTSSFVIFKLSSNCPKSLLNDLYPDLSNRLIPCYSNFESQGTISYTYYLTGNSIPCSYIAFNDCVNITITME
jgi:hypothetical protein